jgi:gas vesicle protein
MKQLFSFLAGVIVGGVAALLLAPMSGEDLRRQIQEEANAELKKVDAEWKKIMQQVNQTVEDTQAELRAYIERAQADKSEEAIDEATAEATSGDSA